MSVRTQQIDRLHTEATTAASCRTHETGVGVMQYYNKCNEARLTLKTGIVQRGTAERPPLS